MNYEKDYNNFHKRYSPDNKQLNVGSENYSCKRIARGKHMNVLTLSGMTKKKIPVYTKGCEERDELIKNYYKYCNIVESEIQEVNL